MATTPLVPIVKGKFLTTSWEDLHEVESPVNRIGIDAACFDNTSASNVTYDVRIVQDGTGSNNDSFINSKTIRANSNDLAPGIIGQAVQVNGKIQAKASVSNVVAVHITATEITS